MSALHKVGALVWIKVTMIFITHQVPKGLQVDEVVDMGQHAMHMSLVEEEV